MKNRGLLIVFSGPSGVGKGTILKEYLAGHPAVSYSVSATTRLPRPGETDGVEYYFLTKEQFAQRIDAGQMLEYAEFAGNFYGTPLPPVEEKLSAGLDVVLEIEVQGALQVKSRLPEAFLVFVMPPSFEELARRLTGRGTENEQAVARRLDTARGEMEKAGLYDAVLVNDEVPRAAAELESLILAAKAARQPG